MKYFLDCEFNGYRGELISLALVREDGQELYLAKPRLRKMDPWVEKKVEPIVTLNDACPVVVEVFCSRIQAFMAGDALPTIIADWPDDIRYFCECLITGPGEMIDIPTGRDAAPYNRTIQFVVERVDAYPTDLPGAVQHNALWDARALRHKLMPVADKEYFCPILHRCPHWLDRCRELGCQHPDAIEMRANG